MNLRSFIRQQLAAAVCFLLAACAQDPERTVTRQMETLLRKRQAQTVLRIADQYISTHPQSPAVTRLRILALLKLDKGDQALEAFQQLPLGDAVWLKALTHRDEDVRVAAARLIANSKELPIPIDHLIHALDDPYPDVRRYCVCALGQQPARIAMKPLLGILTDDNWYVRAEAVTALGKMGDLRVLPWVVSALNDNDVFVRYRTFKALEQMPRQPSRFLLLERLHKVRGPGDYAIALALAKLEDPSAESTLLQILSSADTNTRRNTAITLADIPAPFATNILNVLAQDNNIHVKKAARQTLQKLQSPTLQALPSPSFMENLSLFRDWRDELPKPFLR